MTATDHDLAQATLGAYEYDGKPFTWLRAWELAGDGYGFVRVAGMLTIIYLGTHTDLGWIHDLDTVPYKDHEMGATVSWGFLENVEESLDRILAELPDEELAVIGHSRGASMAEMAAVKLVRRGRKVARLVAWGSPNTGYADFAMCLTAIPRVSYRNVYGGRVDGVTCVPFHLGDAFPYVRPIDFTDVSAAPAPNDPWGPLFDLHHMSLYATVTPAIGAV